MNLKKSSFCNRFQLSIKLKLPTFSDYECSIRSKEDATCAERKAGTSVSTIILSTVCVFTGIAVSRMPSVVLVSDR